jgi:D-3-phosphoglycerate dehydrogenase/glyoxylate/hydroxypyruvate reductase A
MAILVLSRPLPSAPFAEALKQAAHGIPVWTEQDDAPKDKVEVILAWRMKPGILPLYPNLRVLCSTSAGVDKLLVADLPAQVPVTRVVDPMQGMQIAQYVLAFTLRHTRELPLYAAQQARAAWVRHPVRAASRCRIGVLGFGTVGQAIARAFLPLGYPVNGWSRTPREVPGARNFAGRDGLPRLLAQTDVLVCALPLTDETHGLLNRERLAQLPHGAYVINVGRGEQIVEADLRTLLDEGHLAGAALDVFDREPPLPDDWVWSHPKVLATPHIAAQASFDVVAQQCVDALRRARDGLPQPLGADKAVGY